MIFSGSFIPDAEVVFVMFSDGFQYGTPTTFMADADGSIGTSHFFPFWGEDAGHWTFEASVPDTECAGTASVTVTGTVVSIATFICDEDIQSAEDLAAADPNEVCDSLVLPGDEVSVPPGHTDNQATANFDWELHESTAQERHLADATRGGGGTCDPVAKHCTFALSYEWVGAVGPSGLFGHPPAGYRFGTAQWFGPDASAFTVSDYSLICISTSLAAPRNHTRCTSTTSPTAQRPRRRPQILLRRASSRIRRCGRHTVERPPGPHSCSPADSSPRAR